MLRGSTKPALAGRGLTNSTRSGGSKGSEVREATRSFCGKRRTNETGCGLQEVKKVCSSCNNSQGRLRTLGISLMTLT